MGGLTTAQRIWLTVVAIGFMTAGTLHFIKSGAYLRIVPPYVPWHSQLVAVSGFFEILGGLGLLVPTLRRAAAFGLAALLIAVFPANVYMATDPAAAGAVKIPAIVLWARLPLQVVIIWLVLWSSRSRSEI